MVFSEKDIRPELFPTSACLVPTDPSKSYTMTVSDDELENEEVENMYGPFDSPPLIDYSNSSPIGSPRPLMRNEDEVMKGRQQAIDELKKLIEERERRKRELGATLLAAAKVESNPQLPFSTKLEHNSPKIKSSTSEKLKLIIIDDSEDEDMSIDSKDSDMSVESNNNKHPHDAFDSASNQQLTEEEKNDNLAEFNMLTEENKLLEANVEKLMNDLNVLRAEKKDTQVKLLAMKARMSLNKNKSELKKKPSTPEALPTIGKKRDYSTASHENYNKPRPSSSSQRSSRRRLESDQADRMNYGYGSTAAPPPFYQQLPPQVLHGYPQPNYSQPQNIYQPPRPPPGFPPSGPARHTPPQRPPGASFPSNIPSAPPPALVPPSAPYFGRYYTQQQMEPHHPHILKASSTATHKQISNSSMNVRKPPVAITEESSGIEPMKDSLLVESALGEISQFVSLRLFDETAAGHPRIETRLVARPYCLMTVDKYTMPLKVVEIKEGKDPNEWEPPTKEFVLPAGIQTKVVMDHARGESPFLVMLREKADGEKFNPDFEKVVDEIIDSIPPSDDLSTLKIGQAYNVNLDNALQVARTYCSQNPNNEFLAVLKLDLSLYVNGNSALFMDDYNDTAADFPWSIDVEWQRIRAEADYSSKLSLIMDLLRKISSNRTTIDSQASLSSSNVTAEVLIRLLRMGELQQVVKLMTNKEITINTEKAEVFTMDVAPDIYLQAQDTYRIWMLILYYYVNNKVLPDYICSPWMSSLVCDGVPSRPVQFMIDWTTCNFLQQPLDKPTLFGAVNILLSMLKHFGSKACNDVRRKPLLVGVLRTLINFISCTPKYKIAGTLALIRKYEYIVQQVPEIQEIITELKIKSESGSEELIKAIYSAREKMTLSNVLSLSYQIAQAYYQTHGYSQENLVRMSNILLYPLLDPGNKSIQIDIITKKFKAIQDNYTRLITDGPLYQYANVLKVLSLFQAPFEPQINSSKYISAVIERIPLAWVNILFLMVICQSSAGQVSDGEFKAVCGKGMKQVNSIEGRLALEKYAGELYLTSF